VLHELADKGQKVIVCTATDCGAKLYPQHPNIVKIYSTPMDRDMMIDVMRKDGATKVIDATHPYAVNASENIKKATDELGIPLEVIMQRNELDNELAELVDFAENYSDAADKLQATKGNILLTIGSHNIDVFTEKLDKDRLVIRVLPTNDVLKKCESLGIMPNRIIAMQGPFSYDMNKAIYEHYQIRHMVTKDSGKVGGVEEKVLPAVQNGINVIVIKRPRS
jgi:precorrin-6x reductase